jgi:hypothetical protein
MLEQGEYDVAGVFCGVCLAELSIGCYLLSLLQLWLFEIRTFRVVGGTFYPSRHQRSSFLLPLLYQVGLGLTPVQSGLLIMPQSLAAMNMKVATPRLLALIGYSPGAHLQYCRFRAFF